MKDFLNLPKTREPDSFPEYLPLSSPSNVVSFPNTNTNRKCTTFSSWLEGVVISLLQMF